MGLEQRLSLDILTYENHILNLTLFLLVSWQLEWKLKL